MPKRTTQFGRVYLVGAGPGNPDLLTVRAKELIETAEVLVYDYLVHPAFTYLMSPDCERICVGKRKGFHSVSQEKIQEILVEKAKSGKNVVRLKGGDPFIFGRGGEEAATLVKEGIEFEVVPGITAAVGASAYSGLPLTNRNTNATLVFLTGHEDPDKPDSTLDFKSLPKTNVTVCIYMGVANLGKIAAGMTEAGFSKDLPVSCVEWATLGHQRICRGKLGTIEKVALEFGLRAPAIVIVGESAGMSEDLSWFEKKPLQGRRLVVTRSQGQASELSVKLERLGAEVVGLPLIQIEGAVDQQTAQDVFAEIGSYDWLVFSSPNGVRYFFEAFFEQFDDIRSLGFLRIAAVGRSTAKEIKKFYVTTDLIPEEANADSLADALIATDSMDSGKVLLVSGNLGRDVLVDKLEEARAIVDRFEVYKTQPTDLSDHPSAKAFRENGADGILFTSSSGVKSFVAQAKHLMLAKGATAPKTFSIGKITSATMTEVGMPVDHQAKEANLDSLVDAVIRRFGK